MKDLTVVEIFLGRPGSLIWKGLRLDHVDLRLSGFEGSTRFPDLEGIETRSDHMSMGRIQVDQVP